MKLGAGLFFGLVMGIAAALTAYFSGYSFLASLGLYIVFGICGVFAVTGALWLGLAFSRSEIDPKPVSSQKVRIDKPTKH